MFQASCPALLHYTMLLCQSLSSFPPPACPDMVVDINNALSLHIFRLYCLLGMPYLHHPSLSRLSKLEGFTDNTCTLTSINSYNKLYLPLAERLLHFSSKSPSPSTFLWKQDISYYCCYARLISSISSFLVVTINLAITGTIYLMKYDTIFYYNYKLLYYWNVTSHRAEVIIHLWLA